MMAVAMMMRMMLSSRAVTMMTVMTATASWAKVSAAATTAGACRRGGTTTASSPAATTAAFVVNRSKADGTTPTPWAPNSRRGMDTVRRRDDSAEDWFPLNAKRGGGGGGARGGGGGFGSSRSKASPSSSSSTTSTSSRVDKKIKKRKKRRGFDADLAIGDDERRSNDQIRMTGDDDNNRNSNHGDGEEFDKWGLPPPTAEDIFPPMSEDTELIPARRPGGNDERPYTLREIQRALRDYVPLGKLSERFDEDGIERIRRRRKARDRQPMELRLVHESPPVLVIDNFFSPEECDRVKAVATDQSPLEPVMVDSATMSSSLSQSKRTSTSWFCYYEQVPELLAKARHALGFTLRNMEEPQIVRYRPGQEFSWHYDELPRHPPELLSNGGQRVATLLVYLNDVPDGRGGGTVFRDLRPSPEIATTPTTPTTREREREQQRRPQLTVRPKLGSACLFFPAYGDGTPDQRTLHKGEVMTPSDTAEKWIVQMWIHEREYSAVLPTALNRQDAAVPAMTKLCEQWGYDVD